MVIPNNNWFNQLVMSINPEKVVKHYTICEDRGLVDLLKIFLNNMMRHSFTLDVKTSKICSQILSAIDSDEVDNLPDPELSFLDKHLIHHRYNS
jgi:hypothetical protein